MADKEMLGVVPSETRRRLSFFMSKCGSEYKDLPEQVFLLVKMHQTCTNQYLTYQIQNSME